MFCGFVLEQKNFLGYVFLHIPNYIIFSNLYVFSNFSSMYTFATSFNSSMDSSGIVNEKIFFASDIIAYLIAYSVASDILITLLSSFAHVSHFMPLSFILKWVIFSFAPHVVHSSTFGVNPY